MASLPTPEIGLVLPFLSVDSRLRAGALANATLLLASCGPTLPDSKPLDYDEALDTFQVMEGFRIELTAAGPYVLEPVEINRLSLAPSRHRF